eukprot:scaffold60102_cov64-Phaeocystis_antarctica.AAC.2
MSPSRTASLAILVPTRSPVYEISKSQKSSHATLSQVVPRQPVIPPAPPLYSGQAGGRGYGNSPRTRAAPKVPAHGPATRTQTG